MKIVVVFHDNSIYSGATKSMLSIVRCWIECGNIVAAIVPGNGTLAIELKKLGIYQYKHPKIRARVNLSRSFLFRCAMRLLSIMSTALGYVYTRVFLYKNIKEFSPDVIYSNTTSTPVGYFLSKRVNALHVWHVREFGIEDQNCSYVFGDKRLYRMLDVASLVIAISEPVAKAYSSKIKKEINVVYNDISTDYDLKLDRDYASKEIRILSCGSLIEGKGHQDAIQAVKLLNNEGYHIELLIAGSGKLYEAELQNIAFGGSYDEHIRFLGQVKDLTEFRKRCLIGTVCSRKEAFGRVTVEDMLSGMLVIGTNTGGTATLIDSGNTGLLYTPGDYYELADLIKSVVDDRKLMKKIAQKGYTYAQNFTRGRCAGTILNLMDTMLRERVNQ